MPTDLSFESLAASLTGKDKDLFLDVLRGLLCWLPEERPTQLEAFDHIWLRSAEFTPREQDFLEILYDWQGTENSWKRSSRPHAESPSA